MPRVPLSYMERLPHEERIALLEKMSREKIVAESPVLTKDTAMTATEEFARLRDAHQARHGCTGTCPSDTTNKEHPELWKRIQKEGPQRLPVMKDIQQVIPPPATKGQQTFEALQKQVRHKHPDWSDNAVFDAVHNSEEGQAALAQHREEHLFGR
jgi:hypothetical protein